MIERKQAIAAGVVAVIALLGLSIFAAESFLVKSQEMNFDVNGTAEDMEDNSTKNLGIVTEPNLEFGRAALGTSYYKFIQVNSTNQALVTLTAEGNISDQISYPEKSYFQGSEELKIEFNATEQGYYTGTLNMKIRTSENSLGKTWLNIRNSVF